MQKAFAQMTGYVRREDNLFERFSEVFYNSVFAFQEVQEALESSGFNSIRIVSAIDLEQPLEHPEKEGRVIPITQL